MAAESSPVRPPADSVHEHLGVVQEIHRLIRQKAEKIHSEDSGWSYRLQTILVHLLMEIWAARTETRTAWVLSGDIRLYVLHPKK